MPAWTTDGDGLRCDRHGERFARGKCCTGCVDDPGSEPLLVSVEDLEDDAGMLGVNDYEKLMHKNGLALRRMARRIKFGQVECQGCPVLAEIKAHEASLKAFRAAAEFATKRRDAKAITRMEDSIKALVAARERMRSSEARN